MLGVWRFQTLISAILEQAGHPNTAVVITDADAGTAVYQACVNRNGSVSTSSQPGVEQLPSWTHSVAHNGAVQ